MKTAKLCPKCGVPMVLRTNSRDGSQFWGCSSYPACQTTQPLSETDKLLAAGVPGLFNEVIPDE